MSVALVASAMGPADEAADAQNRRSEMDYFPNPAAGRHARRLRCCCCDLIDDKIIVIGFFTRYRNVCPLTAARMPGPDDSVERDIPLLFDRYHRVPGVRTNGNACPGVRTDTDRTAPAALELAGDDHLGHPESDGAPTFVRILNKNLPHRSTNTTKITSTTRGGEVGEPRQREGALCRSFSCMA